MVFNENELRNVLEPMKSLEKLGLREVRFPDNGSIIQLKSVETFVISLPRDESKIPFLFDKLESCRIVFESVLHENFYNFIGQHPNKKNLTICCRVIKQKKKQFFINRPKSGKKLKKKIENHVKNDAQRENITVFPLKILNFVWNYINNAYLGSKTSANWIY